MKDFMRFVKINKICVIIALVVGTASFAQANIDVIQYSAEFVKDNEFEVTDGTVKEIIRNYTRESGVRNLEREISKTVTQSMDF